MDVTIIVATFGDDTWAALAQERAVPSAAAQCDRVIHTHADTLHKARNLGLAQADTEWVVHLDADDELEPGYLDAMAAAEERWTDVLVPRVAYVRRGRRLPPVMPRVAGHTHDCTRDCLPHGNWIVIGAAVRTALARLVGGWRDFDVYEDWDLWLRCYLADARIVPVPDAIYRAHVRPDSRNRAPDMALKNTVHAAIVAANQVAA